jgi:hypothetical protein
MMLNLDNYESCVRYLYMCKEYNKNEKDIELIGYLEHIIELQNNNIDFSLSDYLMINKIDYKTRVVPCFMDKYRSIFDLIASRFSNEQKNYLNSIKD